MKNEDIKTGLKYCIQLDKCNECPYYSVGDFCTITLIHDTVQLIEQMEQRLSVK